MSLNRALALVATGFLYGCVADFFSVTILSWRFWVGWAFVCLLSPDIRGLFKD